MINQISPVLPKRGKKKAVKKPRVRIPRLNPERSLAGANANICRLECDMARMRSQMKTLLQVVDHLATSVIELKRDPVLY